MALGKAIVAAADAWAPDRSGAIGCRRFHVAPLMMAVTGPVDVSAVIAS
jgi:hypothetical protein